MTVPQCFLPCLHHVQFIIPPQANTQLVPAPTESFRPSTNPHSPNTAAHTSINLRHRRTATRKEAMGVASPSRESPSCTTQSTATGRTLLSYPIAPPPIPRSRHTHSVRLASTADDHDVAVAVAVSAISTALGRYSCCAVAISQPPATLVVDETNNWLGLLADAAAGRCGCRCLRRSPRRCRCRC